MRIIYCAEPFSTDEPDQAYKQEVEAALKLGFRINLINYEALVDEDNPSLAIRSIESTTTPELALYRGWMLTPRQYARLFAALAGRNLRLINTPEQYLNCHYMPESFPIIADYTAPSVFLPSSEGFSMDKIVELLKPFGDHPVVLKDFVKSRKHEWNEAVFIPSASDRDAVQRVVNRFLELQGQNLNGGLVFRQFVELQPLTIHSKSGMPLTREFRTFILAGMPLLTAQYWEEGDYEGAIPSKNLFADVVKQVKSNFYTMDVAERKDGSWIIIELGDGQVAGLPENIDVTEFYSRLEDTTERLSISLT